MFEELVQELNLSEEQASKLVDEVTKLNQSETDKVRTKYSSELKELKDELIKYKPKEKSETEIELENLKKELSEVQFQKSLKDLGVSDDLGKYLRSDIDLESFKEVYKGFAQNQQDFIPNNMNQNESSITKEQFKNMNYQQKAELYEKSPELFQLLNQK